MSFFKKLLRDEAGQGMVEYALVIALIAIAAIVAINLLGGRITTLFTNTASQMPS